MFPWNNKQFPFNQQTKDLFENGFPENIESYVQGIVGKSMRQFSPDFPFHTEAESSNFSSENEEQADISNNAVKYHVFETHDDVYIRIPIDEKRLLENVKIYHTSNKSIVEGLPTHADKLEIILPAIVKKKGAHAIYKDGLLQIRIPKNTDFQFTEIDVQEK